ncbi:lysine 2,3-aminomutase [Legionella waltersii]|uniref:L-lysine 2,3-aminomutase n=1 Tax=Legionella waltersii TaxID=66969 RepID=A0A0W1ADK1_9GAMM|nr:lysine 2,3-aminomutase [Legionella waltersii]SNU97842.1 lysine 2,3-aminomutase [Legionella waltersii]
MSWQKILAQGFNTASDLLSFLELPQTCDESLAEKQFPSRVPLGFARRMQKKNPCDPLLLQVLATKAEMDDTTGYVDDPLKEVPTALSGLLHKYYGRVLLTLTGTCAVNCRFCFRRHFPYQENNPGRKGWQDICDYIAKDQTIKEVILSGGDPLLAADIVLRELIEQLQQIPHVEILRVHTRVPIVLPERIDADFLSLLAATKLKKVIVLHCNHEQELDETVLTACEDLKAVGCYLLNQTVLLADINDDANALMALSYKLFNYGILPYYLHLLDKVKGAAHFDLPVERAKAIYKELQELVPGYLLPKLVREESGKHSKTLII